METYQPGMKAKVAEILSAPPRSGHFSIYAQKLSAQAFVWLCGIVVWGNVVNKASIIKECGVSCAFQITFALLTWIIASIILGLNYLAESSLSWRTGCFSHGVEAQLTAVLVILWIPVVATVSSIGAAPRVATWFAWLGFLGSMYATFKAYHSFKEEDLPSDLPDGFDEEEYVYG